jgi:methyl-accepting chemotaxis protein
MFRFRTSIRTKLILMGVGSILLTAVALVGVGAYQSNAFSMAAKDEVDGLVEGDLDHITQGVYNLIAAQDEAVQQQVDHNISVARHVLDGLGKVHLSDEEVTWEAVNQFTNTGEQVELPRVLVGDTWLGQNVDAGIETPVVDEVQSLVGGAATIFQRMNERGDMLRVATNVTKQDGSRAIGTYIPATNPDGTPNPVVSTVLRGETYRGIATVVGTPYTAAYEPIVDDTGKVIGVLFSGVKLETGAALRQAILKTKVGQSGYVYVLGGEGDDQGHYIVSKDSARDGEDIWEAKDASGNYFIQSIVTQALSLKPGEFGTERYLWQNEGDAQPRWKVARIAYYEPWDWVIGAGTYEDDFNAYLDRLQAGQSNMILTLAGIGLAIAIVGGMVVWLIASSIATPLKQVAHAADSLSAGDVSQAVTHRSEDEVGKLADAFRQLIAYQKEMTAAADHLAEGDLTAEVSPRSDFDLLGHAFHKMIDNLRRLVAQVAEGAESVSAASTQLASAATQAGEATNQITLTMQQVSQGTGQQTEAVSRASSSVEQLSRAIDGVARGAQEQAESVSKAATLAGQISTAVQQVAASARAGAEGSRQATDAAKIGVETVEQTIEGMNAIKEKVGLSTEKVREMGRHSDQIGAIVQTIDDIASQTNLLALNAAIEAARAGEHGKGFAVVADEVRKLAEKSASATKEIATLIRGIQTSIGEAVSAMDEGAAEVETGVSRASQSGRVLNEILQAVQKVNQQVAEIAESAKAMDESAREMVTANETVSAVVEENTAATEEMAASSGEVSQVIDSIASVSQENSAAAEEVTASSEEMSAQVEEVSASAQSLAEMAQALQDVVSQFRLADEQVGGRRSAPAAPTATPANGTNGSGNGHRVKTMAHV